MTGVLFTTLLPQAGDFFHRVREQKRAITSKSDCNELGQSRVRPLPGHFVCRLRVPAMDSAAIGVNAKTA